MKNITPYKKIIIAGGIAALLGISAYAGWMFSAPTRAPAPDAPALSDGFADSAAHVSASFAQNGEAGVLILHTEEDWHVNANPVSLEGLIPATVWIEQGDTQRPAQAAYPPGQSIGIVIDDKDILIYKDSTRIEIADLGEAQGGRVLVHMQACSSQGICLAPATITATREPVEQLGS